MGAICNIFEYDDSNRSNHGLSEDEVKDYFKSDQEDALTYDEAVQEYRRLSCTPIGRLIAARELPVLERAKEILR